MRKKTALVHFTNYQEQGQGWVQYHFWNSLHDDNRMSNSWLKKHMLVSKYKRCKNQWWLAFHRTHSGCWHSEGDNDDKQRWTEQHSLCLAKHHAMMTCGSGGIAPHILNLITRWKCVASFKHQVLYPWGKRPQYSFHRMLGGPQNWSGHGDEHKKSLPLPQMESNIEWGTLATQSK
jgi:hypothetical protein